MAILVFAAFARVYSQSTPQIIVEKVSDAIEGGTNAIFRVGLNAPLPATENINITFATTGTATLSTDYNIYNTAGMTAVIPAGATTTTVEFDAGNDGLIEGPETAGLQLLSANTSSGSYAIDATLSAATALIVDANAASTTPIQVLSGTSPMEPATSGSFTVKLAGVATSAWPVSIAYVLSGTSVAGVDYQSIGNLTIPANTNSIQVLLNVIDDHIIEQAETFTITLLSGSATDGGGNAFIFPPDPANSHITATLVDDDNTPVNQMLSIIKTADAAEPGTSGHFKISLPGDYVCSAPINIAYTPTGTATSGVDYTLNTAVLPAYQHSIDVPITVLDDAISEPKETLTLTLEATIDGNNGSYTPDPISNAATLTIADDDSPLPLDLISFTGQSQTKGGVLLKWKTVAEHNTDYFILERSSDGKSFLPVNKINAKGTDNNEYSAVDQNPLPLSFYRLQMVDKDHVVQYSDIIRVQNGAQKSGEAYFYPNPAKGEVRLKISNDKLLNTKAILINTTGQIKQVINLTQHDQVVSLEHYAAGLYFLKFENGTYIKLIIQ